MPKPPRPRNPSGRPPSGPRSPSDSRPESGPRSESGSRAPSAKGPRPPAKGSRSAATAQHAPAKGNRFRREEPHLMERPPEPAPKMLRIIGLPAVSALFERNGRLVERLFFDERNAAAVAGFCREL